MYVTFVAVDAGQIRGDKISPAAMATNTHTAQRGIDVRSLPVLFWFCLPGIPRGFLRFGDEDGGGGGGSLLTWSCYGHKS